MALSHPSAVWEGTDLAAPRKCKTYRSQGNLLTSYMMLHNVTMVIVINRQHESRKISLFVKIIGSNFTVFASSIMVIMTTCRHYIVMFSTV